MGRLLDPWGVSFLFVSLLFGMELWSVPSFSPNCAVHVAQYEKRHTIPHGLLHAISKVESGRKDAKGYLVAWPWTVNAEGQGYYFSSKEEAIAAVQQFQLKGIKSIDVGCMQINLYHHPYAFKNLQDAFDPAKNVAYAASFLTRLKNSHASWYEAVSHYHSANPIHHLVYRQNVLNTWRRGGSTQDLLLAARNLRESPRVNRLRRLTMLRRARLKKTIHHQFSKAAVRRVTRTSRHLKHPPSRSLAMNQ